MALIVGGWVLWHSSVVLVALGLDRLIGEPTSYHPLVGFGRLASALEARLNRRSASIARSLCCGAIAWALLVVPITVALACLILPDAVYWLVSVACLYCSLGWQSLREHGHAVSNAYRNQGIALARDSVARMVSRDTDSMDEAAVSRATIESVLENGSDAIFAPLCWFLIAGPAGAVCYRLCNTLDAMWGYRTERYRWFGAFSAKMDDFLNWLPARLTALSYALFGQTAEAIRCWCEQSSACASPNGGPVMCSGAGALGIKLGGGAYYHGVWQQRPIMGCGRSASVGDIDRSIALIDKTVGLWSAVLVVTCFVVLLNSQI